MNPFRAALYPLKGLALVAMRRELWGPAAGAVAINVAVFAALLAVLALGVPPLTERLLPESWPAWAARLTGCAVAMALGVAVLFLFTAVGSIVAGPFLEELARRVLRGAGEALPPDPGWGVMLVRIAGNQAWLLAAFLLAQALLLAMWLIPVVGTVHPVLSALLGVYFVSLSYVGIALEVRGVHGVARYRWMTAHLGPAMGFGAVLFLILLVPLLGYLLMPVTAAGAALLVHDLGEATSSGVSASSDPSPRASPGA